MIEQSLAVFGLMLLGVVLVEAIDAAFDRSMPRLLTDVRTVMPQIVLGHPRLSLVAPLLTLSAIAAAASFIPFWSAYRNGHADAGLFLYAMLIDFGIVGVAAAGWSVNNPRGVAASFGAIAQFISYGIVIGFGMIGPAMVARSLSPSAIIASQHGLWQVAIQPISFLLYFVGALAQSLRHPFAQPLGGPQQSAGAIAALGGAPRVIMRIALDLLGFAVAAMGVALFFGGWLGAPDAFSTWLLFAKTSLWLIAVAALRSAVRQIRYEQMLHLFWKVCMPAALINIIIVGAVILVFKP